MIRGELTSTDTGNTNFLNILKLHTFSFYGDQSINLKTWISAPHTITKPAALCTEFANSRLSRGVSVFVTNQGKGFPSLSLSLRTLSHLARESVRILCQQGTLLAQLRTLVYRLNRVYTLMVAPLGSFSVWIPVLGCRY